MARRRLKHTFDSIVSPPSDKDVLLHIDMRALGLAFNSRGGTSHWRLPLKHTSVQSAAAHDGCVLTSGGDRDKIGVSVMPAHSNMHESLCVQPPITDELALRVLFDGYVHCMSRHLWG